MLQESSNIAFIIVIILFECHVICSFPQCFQPSWNKSQWKWQMSLPAFSLSSSVSRACVRSQCSFSMVWSCPNFHPLLLFKMASICKLLLSPCFFWFVSQQNLFMKSVQLLIVVLSYCFFSHTCLYKKWLQSQNANKIFFNVRFFFNHCVSSQLNHFVHFFHFLYSWSL